jgi:hypothetical protein
VSMCRIAYLVIFRMCFTVDLFHVLFIRICILVLPAVGPTQPPVQWARGALSAGVKRGRGVMLTVHPLLVPMLKRGAIPALRPSAFYGV